MADLMEPAYRKLAADRSLPPLTRGNLFHALGRTFHGLARYETASDAFRSAYELRRQALGPTHRDTLESMAEIVFEMVPDPEASEPLGREALALCEKTLGDDDRITIRCRSNLTGCVIRVLPARAISLAERNLRLAEARYPPGDILVLDCLHLLAFAYGMTGRTGDALPLGERAYNGKKKSLGPDHPQALLARNTLAWLLFDHGDFFESGALDRENLEARRKMLRELHPETLGTVASLADTLRQTGRLSEAEKLLRDNLEHAEARLDPEDPSVPGQKVCTKFARTLRWR